MLGVKKDQEGDGGSGTSTSSPARAGHRHEGLPSKTERHRIPPSIV